jgi:DNA-binding IclR family transcriptional regulator
MRNRSPDGLRSVDSALVLATALQQEGPMRVTDAAERLGVSVSTAHRLLAALVHRDFAVQLPDRRYGPGQLLRGDDAHRDAVTRLRTSALPSMRRLVDAWEETVNLTVLVGNSVRFIATVECGHVLRVGDRMGRTLPAHLSSGGKAMLARLTPGELRSTMGSLDEPALERLHRELRAVRRRGFAVNDQQTEKGLSAVGVALPGVEGIPPASLALAMPTARWSPGSVPAWSADLTAAAGEIASALSGGTSSGNTSAGRGVHRS